MEGRVMENSRVAEILSEALEKIESDFGIVIDRMEIQWRESTSLDDDRRRSRVLDIKIDAQCR